MSDLMEMLQHRDREFSAATSGIFRMMPEVLKGVVKFLKVEHEAKNNNLSWEDISIIHDPIEEFIMIVGVIQYEPGDEFLLEDKKIIITEETADYFRRMVRVGIPIPLAVSGTAAEVHDFLEKSALQSEEDEQEMIDNSIDEMAQNLDDDDDDDDDDNGQPQMHDLEKFDLNTLDDHQLESFHFFQKFMGNTKK